MCAGTLKKSGALDIPGSVLFNQTLGPRASEMHKHDTARKGIPVLAMRSEFATRASSVRRSCPRSPSLRVHTSERVVTNRTNREKARTPCQIARNHEYLAQQLPASYYLKATAHCLLVFYQSASTVPCCLATDAINEHCNADAISANSSTA